MNLEELSLDGFSMRYCTFGNPAGQPLVILPGVALKSVLLTAALVENQYQAFAEQYHVFLFDRRTGFPAKYPVAAMAEDTAQVMDALGIRQACVYGVSEGGMMALDIALKHPKLVRKLALCSTAPDVPPSALNILHEWSEAAQTQDIPGLMTSFAEYVYTPAYAQKHRQSFLAFGKHITPDDLSRFGVMVNAIIGFDVTARLHEITAPVLVIGAEKDRIFGAGSARKIAECTGGQLVVYPEDAHGVYDENPDVLIKLKAFLDA